MTLVNTVTNQHSTTIWKQTLGRMAAGSIIIGCLMMSYFKSQIAGAKPESSAGVWCVWQNAEDMSTSRSKGKTSRLIL